MLKQLVTLFFVLLMAVALAAEEPDHADHEELRALLKGVEQAMTSADYDKLLPYFTERARVTVINQDHPKTPAEFKAYFQDWIGAGKYVKTLKMTLTADDLTEFYGSGEGRFGIVRGQGRELYDLSDGRHLDMETRWTATVVKDQGHWKIVALHLGANFYKNPIVAAIQDSTKLYAAGGAVVGFLAGAGLVFLLRRKRV